MRRTSPRREAELWFTFPQFRGLGASFTSQKYAIRSIEEAQAYLAHPLLGARLRECVDLVNRIHDRPIDAIFGYPDTMKFRSSLRLFCEAAADNAIFKDALQKYFAGMSDPRTLSLLKGPSP